MRKIGMNEVMREIYDAHHEYFMNELALGRSKVPYTYDMFRSDMIRHELVNDRGTIKTKWDILRSNDVVCKATLNGVMRDALDLAKFFAFLPHDGKILLRQCGGVERNTVNITGGGYL